jgi:hypothetical protein
MRYISSIDMYGTTFQFTTNKKTKFRTIMGGILSLITFGVLIAFSFLFGQNFFYRVNPSIVSHIANPEKFPPLIKLTGENLFIPFQIADNNLAPAAFEGIVYPSIYYYKYSKGANGVWNQDIFKRMDAVKCDKTKARPKDFNVNIKLSEYYCADWGNDEYYFGGSYDGDEIGYYIISLDYCPEGKKYSPTGGCTKLTDLQKRLYEIYYYFQVYYPIYFFDPEDKENPLKINYKNYFYKLDILLQKTDRLYFREAQVSDDQGLIVVDEKRYSAYGLSYQQSDFNLFDLNSYNVTGTRSRFYSFFVYFDKNYQKFNRTYMKFQDLAALIGGFMKILLIATEMINYLFNIHLRNEFLLNKLFDFSKDDFEKQ